MRTPTCRLAVAALIAGLLLPAIAAAQLTVGGHAALQGTYVEVGVDKDGFFGLPLANVPTGYHANSTHNGNGLGFIADYRKNGWTGQWGGDYFTPGTPYEGFAVAWNNGTLRNFGNFGGAGVTLPSLGLTYSSSGNVRSATWSGEVASGSEKLRVIQTYTVHTTDLYFTANVQVINTGTVALNNVEFARSVDPDNDVTWPGGSYSTFNQIVYQPPNAASEALVTATGTVVTDMLVGLGAIDSRAAVRSGFTFATTSIANMLTGISSGSQTGDNAMAIIFSLGTLNPGQSTSLDYAYILSAADLTTALGSLAAITTLQPTGLISGSSVPFQVKTNDMAHTTSVDFYVNGVLIGTSTAEVGGAFSYTFDSTAYPDGNLTLRAVATINGVQVEKSSTVVVDNAGPPMAFTIPTAGQAVTGNGLTATVAATNALNPPTSVTFYREANGATVLLGTVTSAPFTTTYNTSDLPSGTLVAIRAYGVNAAGKTTTVTVSVFATTGTAITTTPGTTAYGAPGGAVVVDPAVTILSSSAINQATVSITSGYVSGQDVLGFTPQSGITGSFNATTGILSLTGAGTAATYEAALRSVTFANGSGSPTVGLRQVTFALGSGLYYSGTNHFYEYVASAGVNWSAANTAASGRSYFGLTGYLATVTSSGENGFIQAKLAGDGWMGASTPSFTVPRTWSWVTGPEAGTAFFTQTGAGTGTAIGGAYVNWASGEPNNSGGVENYAHFYSSNGTWNDFAGNNPSIAGYVVEYGGLAGDPSVLLTGTRAVQVSVATFPVTFATDGTAGATLTGTTSQTITYGGSATAVTANAPANHYFVNWTGTGGFVTTTSNPLTVTNVTAAHAITANFAAMAATSVAVTSSAQPSVWGEPVHFTATLTPLTATGTVQFKVDGVNLGTPVTLASGVASSTSTSSLSVASHAVTAAYSGATAYLPSTGSTTQDVGKASTDISVLPSLSSFSYGTPIVLTATIGVTGFGAGTPTGSVDFTADGVTIPGCASVGVVSGTTATCATNLIPAGTAVVGAAYLGDADFLPSGTGTAVVAVSQATPSVVATASPNPAIYGDTVTLTATVSGAGATPGGTVTFVDGATTLCSGILNGSGVATCTATGFAVGSHTVTAGFGGDSNYAANVGTVTLVVDAAPTSLALSASPASPSTYGQSVTFTATVTSSRGTPTGSVTFSDGATTLCAARPLTTGVATCAVSSLTAGSHGIGAAYPGDGTFAAASSTIPSFAVNKATTAAVLTSSNLLASVGSPITLTATVSVGSPGSGSPTGTVTFYSGGVSFGTGSVSGGVATLTTWTPAGGTYGLTASYAGDSNFSGSASAQLLQQVLGTFPIVEPFKDATATGWEMIGTASLTSGGVDPSGAGWLRLTDALNGEAGSALYAPPFSSSEGIVVTFDYAMYGGSGADGFSFYLIDGATLTPTVGAPGGSLGYANASSSCGGSVTAAGVTNGFVGIGFDEYGNFSNCNVGSGGPGQAPNSVVIRGSGSQSAVGFGYLAGQGVAQGMATGSRVAARRVRISIVNQKIKVEMNFGGGFTTIVDNVDLATATGQVALPATFKMGFSASTGGSTNIHEIRNLNVAKPATLAVTNLAAPTSAAAGDPITWTVTVANDNLNDVAGLGLAVPLPTGVAGVTWTAAAAGGATVPNASGTGAIAETIDLPKNGSAVFTITGTLSTAVAGTVVTTTATITPPPSIANLGNDSASATVAVGQLASVVVLSSSANPSVYGTPVTFSATVSGSGAVPSGTVTFLDGGSIDLCGPVTLVGGTASCLVSVPGAGSHAITAAYSGDIPYLPAGDALTQVVDKAGTTVDLVSSTNPSVYGSPATFTATVTSLALGGDVPTGTVLFFDGTTLLGSGTVGVGGQASFTTDLLLAGLHAITASYQGDGSFRGADSAPVTQDVTKAPTAVLVAIAPATSVYGQDVTFTVTVDRAPSAAGFTPSGDVEIWDGTTRLQTLTLSGGATTWTTSALSVGTHVITVSYLGAADWQPSGSAPASFDVGKASTVAGLVTDLAATVFGQPLLLTATVTAVAPGRGSPTGTVTFRDGVAVLGTASVVPSTGLATFSWSGLAVGAHDLIATYEGDGNFLTSASAAGAAPVDVAKASVGMTLVSSVPAGSAFGQPVTFTVTVSAVAPGAGTPTGDVTLTDGATTLATITLSSGAGSFTTGALAVGDHPLTASYGGDGSFLTGAAALTQTVAKASTAVAVASSVAPSKFGQPVTWTATVGATAPGVGAPASGTVAFADGAAPIAGCTAIPVLAGVAACTSTALLAGTHTLGAAFSGDGSFLASSGQATQVVEPAASTLVLDVSPSPAAYGQTVTLTLHVSATAPGQGVPSTGTVTFTDGATVLCGPVPVTAGVATCVVSGLLAATHPLAAAFTGDPNFVPRTATASLVVNRGTTEVAIQSSRNPSRRGRPITFTATVTSAYATPVGTVTFRDGETLLGTGTLTAGVATFATRALLKGDHPITAEYVPSPDFVAMTGTLAPIQVVENTPPVAGSGTALALGANGALQADIPVASGALDHATTTVEAWARATWTVPTGVTTPTLVRLGSASSARLALGLSPDRAKLVVTVGSTATEVPAPLDDGGWHHLAVVASATELDLFADGAHVGNVSGGLDAGVTSTALTVGKGFTGQVDEVRVWSTARTAADLTADARRPLHGTEAGLVGYWRMDEGSGPELFDASPSALDGRLVLDDVATPVPFAASAAWSKRDVWQERDMTPADAGYDADGDPLTLSISGAPQHGVGSIDATRLQVGYHPGDGYLGPDQLTFKLDDGTATDEYQLVLSVNRILVCTANAECGGGDLCVQGLCQAPAMLDARSGGCGCSSGAGGATALWALLILAFTARRRTRRETAPAGRQS